MIQWQCNHKFEPLTNGVKFCVLCGQMENNIPTVATYGTTYTEQEPKESQEDKPTLEDKIEFIKGAYQCYVGFPGWDGLLKFLKESKLTITRKS